MVTILLAALLCTQAPRVSERGVDQVRTAGDGYLGALLGTSGDLVRFAVTRDWLGRHDPDQLRRIEADEDRDRDSLRTRLLDRIADWKRQRPDAADLNFFLDDQAERHAQPPPAGERSQFVVLEIPRRRVRRSYVQPDERKRIALLAWREGLADVERRSVADLERELTANGVATDGTPDLSDRVPPVADTAEQWAARQALVEYRRLRPLDFQALGDAVFRTDDAAARPDPGALLGGLASGGGLLGGGLLGGDLADLPGSRPPPRRRQDSPITPKAVRAATAAAEQADARAVRLTALDPDLSAGPVHVETVLLARMPDGSWRAVYRDRASVDPATVDADAVQAIAADPQVERLSGMLGGLGAGMPERALRTGAAVQQATQRVNQRLLEFVSSHDGDLVRPNVVLP